jgi:hypothetical protein
MGPTRPRECNVEGGMQHSMRAVADMERTVGCTPTSVHHVRQDATRSMRCIVAPHEMQRATRHMQRTPWSVAFRHVAQHRSAWCALLHVAHRKYKLWASSCMLHAFAAFHVCSVCMIAALHVAASQNCSVARHQFVERAEHKRVIREALLRAAAKRSP